MTALYLFSFLLVAAAILSLLRIAPADFLDSLAGMARTLRPNRKATLKQQIKKSVREKKIGGIRKIFSDARNELELTHRTDRLRWYTTASVLLFTEGVLVSALFENYFLMPVLAVGLALLPWLSVLLNAASFQKQLNGELETALGMITTSYLRNDNIISAVRENVGSIHYPIREIFEKFLVQADLISSDVTKLLEEMRDSLDNTVFHDWVDQVILCRQNRTLKSTLQPIVSRLSTVREVTGKLENLMYEPVKEFISLAVMVVLNFPMIRLMSPQWYDTITRRTGGQILIAFTFFAVFFSLCACITKTRPAEYRR